MTVKSYKLGPGVLTLGAVPLTVSGQITNCRVDTSENVTSEENLDLLSGEVLVGSESATYKSTLAGSLLQDLDAGGVIDFSWTNRGVEVPFSFTPNTAEGATVTGTVVPIPLTIGGDVKKTQTADFAWRVIGEPDFTAAV